MKNLLFILYVFLLNTDSFAHNIDFSFINDHSTDCIEQVDLIYNSGDDPITLDRKLSIFLENLLINRINSPCLYRVVQKFQHYTRIENVFKKRMSENTESNTIDDEYLMILAKNNVEQIHLS